MAIDYDKLMNYPIPEVRQRYSRKDTAFYALSVGFGQDPLDARQLRFVDQDRTDFCAVPSMAVVLGTPGFWLGHPDTGVDANKLVHGEQSIRLYQPLPAEGEVVGTTRVTSIIDKGAGKGALLYSTKTLVDANTGRKLIDSSSTVFLRADGGFGGPAGPVRQPAPVPTAAPDMVCEFITRPEQALYYRLNGDYNPLHSDPQTAKRAGFAKPILHGLCTFGVICHGLLRLLADYDAAALREVEMRFTAPVIPGETIRIEAWRNGAFRAWSVDKELIVANNGLCKLA